MSTSELPPAEAKLLDVRAVAAMLDCSTRSVYRLADAGKMPAPLKIGSLCRWSRTNVEDWIEGGCQPVRSIRQAGIGREYRRTS